MKANNPKDVFVMLLSHLYQGVNTSTKFYQEIAQLAQKPDIKEALEARAFVAKGTSEKLEQCFKLIGEQPVKLSGRLHEIFVEDFRKELEAIQSPMARHMFILAKAVHMTQLRIGEYVALIAAADVTDHLGVGVLLESCLADKMAFVERSRRLIRHLVAEKVATR